MKKSLLIALFAVVAVVGCGKKDASTSGVKKQVLKLSHNHNEGYPVDLAYKKFAELVSQKSGGRYEIEIYPSAQLGDSKASVELAQSGVIQFAHINSAAMENFNPLFAIFNLPYVFKDYKHFRDTMDSSKVRTIFEQNPESGVVTVLYLEGGARSFYTKNKAIKTPADLKGLKIRVQDSPTHIKMIELLGGTPVSLNFSEVYTGLQQGVIDGAENNAPSLVKTGHAEVAKKYSLNNHLRLSDLLVVSSKFWTPLSEEDKQIFRDSANETIEYFADVWDASEKESLAEAKDKYNVEIETVDTAPFRALVLPLQEQVAGETEGGMDLLNHIRSLEK